MKNAQGSLEYLIIIAAVLAVTAVVVMFITGAFGTSKSSASTSTCQTATSSCFNKIQTGTALKGAGGGCDTICNTGCIDPTTGKGAAGADEGLLLTGCMDGKITAVNTVFQEFGAGTT